MYNKRHIKTGSFWGIIRSNRSIGPRFFRLRVEFAGDAAKLFAAALPGQFCQLDLSKASLPAKELIPAELLDASQRQILLRRPFSFADIISENNDKTCVDILYCVAGPGTLRMTTLGAGDKISIIGPLGNGFSVPDGKKTALLTAGGMGAAPLLYLGRFLKAKFPEMKALAFAGTKTAKELPFEICAEKISCQAGPWLEEFAQCGIESIVATDDGSAGFKGFVTESLVNWLEENRVKKDELIIYSCGPSQMLSKIAAIAERYGIDCQVSLERMMACGIGLCQSCAVECSIAGSAETVYKLCCKDGPIFDSKETVFGDQQDDRAG